MLAVEALLVGIPAVVVGAVVGIVLYGNCLWLLGIEAVDYRLYRLLADSPSK